MNTITKHIALSIVMLSTACQAFGLQGQTLRDCIEAQVAAKAAKEAAVSGYWGIVKSMPSTVWGYVPSVSMPSVSVPSMETVKQYVPSVSMPSVPSMETVKAYIPSMPTKDGVVEFVTENPKTTGAIVAGITAAAATGYLYKTDKLSVPSLKVAKGFTSNKEVIANDELVALLTDAKENNSCSNRARALNLDIVKNDQDLRSLVVQFFTTLAGDASRNIETDYEAVTNYLK